MSDQRRRGVDAAPIFLLVADTIRCLLALGFDGPYRR